jgi:serine/threonine-protein kinase
MAADSRSPTLGHYRIAEKIGEGGMGEVYRARDERLDRDVAIKLLRPGVLPDEHARKRFRKEALALSRLNHPNIETIFDYDADNGVDFIATEYIPGEGLDERLARGALREKEIVLFGSQLADGLAAAHGQNVIHRDLKPSNLRITPDGWLKILDFGLAKLDLPTDGSVESMVFAGTLPYMAPEQVRVEPLDERSDIWSAGAVLYEMATGQRPFRASGLSVAEQILKEMPAAPSSINAHLSLALDAAILKCLDKDPEARYQSAKELAVDLRRIAHTTAASEVVASRPQAPHRERAMLIAAIVAIAALTGSLVLRWRMPTRTPAGALSTTRLNLALPAGYWLGGDTRAVAISPDGETLVYGAVAPDAGTRLYSRRLDDWTSREIPGTEGAYDPFFSPDGEWIGFSTSKGLLKTPLRGGMPQAICEETICAHLQSYGASWGRDGSIVFAQWLSGGHLFRVSANGGTPETLAATRPGEALIYLFPEQLPSGHAVLFTAKQQGQTSIVALPRDSGETRTVIASGSQARYLPSGHLLYVSDGQLKAVPFDPLRIEVLGPARVLADSINDDPRTTAYAVSENGVLAILRDFGAATRLVWKDRGGTTTPIPLKPRDYFQPSVSPDGRRIVVTVKEGTPRNIWIGSVDREPLMQLTSSNDDVFTLWTRDSKRVVYTSGSSGHYNLYWVSADGGGKPERLTDSPNPEKATSWSPNGETLLLNELVESTKSMDIYELSITDKTLKPFLATRFNESEADFSPDGRWVAYQSDETGRFEVYVRAYPHGGVKQEVSVDGGRDPQWSANGRELFFQTETGAVLSVSVSVDAHGLRLGKPVQLFSYPSATRLRSFDATPDGRRFLVVEQGDPASIRPRIDLISGLANELRRNR